MKRQEMSLVIVRVLNQSKITRQLRRHNRFQNEASGDVDGNSASAQSVENSATVAEAQSVQSEASSDVAGNSASAQSVENNATVCGGATVSK